MLAVERTLSQWAAREESLLMGAFAQGGHGSHGGSQWAPLAMSTIRRKGHGRVLFETGAMASTVFVELAGMKVQLGNGSRVAKFHQFGTRRMPQRKVVEATRPDVEELKRRLKANVEAALNAGLAVSSGA